MSANLDKLSVMFDGVDVAGVQRGFDRVMAIEELHKYKADVPWRELVKTAGGIVLQSIGYKDEKRLRAEFNPANADAQTWREWSVVRQHTRFPRVTRVDVAIDYFGCDIRDYTWECMGKSMRLFLDRGRDIETAYFGKSSSRHYFRVYDKGLEQGESRGEWVRVEVTHKPQGEEVLPDGIFSGMFAVRQQFQADDLRFGQRAKLSFLHNEPRWAQYASSRQKRRLLDFAADECGLLEPMPQKAYKKEKPRLLEEVGLWAGAEALASN